MYAIIRTGGRQFRVRENEIVTVERLPGAEGDEVTINEVLFVGGETSKIGVPYVEGASVTGKIVAQDKGKKIHGLTYIKVKQHQTHYGHRQLQTRLLIEKITG